MDQSNYINQQMNHLEKFLIDSGRLEFVADGRITVSELNNALQL